MNIRESLRQARLRNLSRRVPLLSEVIPRLPGELEAIRPEHQEYVNSVSTEDMAVSLEIAAFLKVICDVCRPRRVLDLGSGFSSYVLRLSAMEEPEQNMEITSIDDDREWLMRTHDYLAAKGLPTKGLKELSEFESVANGTFDFIFYDLGRMPRRLQYASEVIPLMEPGGMTLVDDMHKADFAAVLQTALVGTGIRDVNLSPWTTDRFGRFAHLLVKPFQE